MCIGGRLGGCIGCWPKGYPIPNIPLPKPKEHFVVPLTGVVTKCTLVDFVAKVEVRQRFENQNEFPIEAVYEFPLDEGASVYEFYAEIDGKKVEGIIKEKEKAKEIYEDAVAQGHGAYLLEKVDNKENKFKTSIGNLPPGKAVLLTVVYCVEMGFVDGKVKFVLPTNANPPNGQKGYEKFERPKVDAYTKDVPFGLDVTINLEMGSNIKSVSSPSHPITFEFGDAPTQATVRLNNDDQKGSPLLKNLEILATLAKPETPMGRVQVDTKNKKKSVMVSFYPVMDEEADFVNEFIFLVDRSGSMAGSRMKAVKEALQFILRSIPEGSLFNILSFGSNHNWMFTGGSEKLTDSSLDTAFKAVDKMEANMMGTNIINPLNTIFNKAPTKGIPRVLFILTDGEVDNKDACIQAIKYKSNTTRCFAFGIGADVDRELVKGMGESGNGAAEFLAQNEPMEEKILRQLKKALKPAFTDMQVEWEGASVEQSPYYLPPLFAGQRLIVYGLVPQSEKKDITVTLKANSQAEGKVKNEKVFSIKVDLSTPAPGNFINALCARSMIKDLEGGRSYMHDQQGGLISKYKAETVKKEIIELSLGSGVISKYTAFVAVEERDEATGEAAKLVDVNQALQHTSPLPDPIVNPGIRARQQGPPSTGGAHRSGRGGGPILGGRGGGPPGGGGPVAKGAAPSRGAPAAPLILSQSASQTSEPSLSLNSALSRRAATVDDDSEEDLDGDWDSPRGSPQASLARSSSPTFGKSGASKKGGVAEREEKKKNSKEKKEKKEKMDRSVLKSDDKKRSRESAAPPRPAAAPALSSTPVAGGGPPAPPGASAPSRQSLIAPSPPPPSTGGNIVSQIVKTQKASGSFTIDTLKLLKGSAAISDIDKILTDNKVTANDTTRSMMITAIVIAFLEKKCAENKGSWELVVEKSRKWIKKESNANKFSYEWEVFASSFVNQL